MNGNVRGDKSPETDTPERVDGSPTWEKAPFAVVAIGAFGSGLTDALVGWLLSLAFWEAVVGPWDHTAPVWVNVVAWALFYGYRVCYAVAIAASSVSLIRREPARYQDLCLALALSFWVLRELAFTSGCMPVPLT